MRKWHGASGASLFQSREGARLSSPRLCMFGGVQICVDNRNIVEQCCRGTAAVGTPAEVVTFPLLGHADPADATGSTGEAHMKDFVQNMDDQGQLVAMVLKLQEIVRLTRAEAQVGSERFDSDQASR